MKLNKRKRFDLYVVCALIVAAGYLSLLLRLDIIGSIALYLILPAVYLCWREPKNYLKILLGSSLLTLFGVSLDVIAEKNHAWAVPIKYPILSYEVFGYTPLALVAWGFCVALFTFVFYEHFLDDERHPAISKHFLYALLACVWAFISVGVVITLTPQLLSMPYAYLALVGTAELPLIWVLLRRPHLFRKLFLLAIFFFALNLLFEITALTLGQWTFPGQYIGWVTLLGVHFPVEELILWIVLSSPVAVFYYEELVDDGK